LKGTLTYASTGVWNNTNLNASNGAQGNVDGDGDIDVGGTDQNTETSGWIVVTLPPSTYDPGLHQLIGTGTFTQTGGNPNGLQSDLTVLLPNKTSGSVSSRNFDFFFDNGTQYSMAGNNSNLTVGEPIEIEGEDVPEPLTMSVLAMGGLGLLLRRRNRA
jgi:hypothetical protein